MRIALIVHDYHRQGGHSRYVAELAERYAQAGHETHVFANGIAPGIAHFPEPAGQPRLYVHRVPAWRFAALGTVLSFYLPASALLRKHGPFDIVHGQGFTSMGCNVLTAHICCAAWHEQRVRSGHMFGWKEKLFDAVVIRLESWLFGRRPARPVIAISRRIQEDLREYYQRTENVTVIGHGVDCRQFDGSQRAAWGKQKRSELGLAHEAFVALWVGDLRKGFEAAMEAVAKHPGQQLLAVARNDPRDFQAKARALGIAERVLILPPTDRIHEYYAAADVFLFPTTYDAFGMVVLEAMAMGLPCIVSSQAGAAELITHGEDGLLLERPFDPDESAAWLRKLEQEPAWRLRMGQAAQQRAQSESWDRVAERTLAVYRALLRVPGKQGGLG